VFGKRSENSSSGGFGGFLAEGTEIEGEVRFADELRIDGALSGRILSKQGRLVIGKSGSVTADIEVGTASIGGTVSGTLTATVKVEIHATGRVYGDIFAPALIIEEGAIFDGRCEMGRGEKRGPEAVEERAAIASIAS
jgi:cytoskeletal protein CcmA (bactofilin family)